MTRPFPFDMLWAPAACTCSLGWCARHEQELDEFRRHPTLARFRAVLGVIGYVASLCPNCRRGRRECEESDPLTRPDACTLRILGDLEAFIAGRIFGALNDAPMIPADDDSRWEMIDRLLRPHLLSALDDAVTRGVLIEPEVCVKIDGDLVRFHAHNPPSTSLCACGDPECWGCYPS